MSAGPIRVWRTVARCFALAVLVAAVCAAGAQAASGVYVAVRGSGPFPSTPGVVSQFDIVLPTGVLAPKSPPTLADNDGPTFVAASPDGRSVYVTNLGGRSPHVAGNVAQFSVNTITGALSPKIPANVPAGLDPDGMAVTPDGRSAYVANTNGEDIPGGTTVSQYDIDPQTGALTPKAPAAVPTGGLTSIRVAVSPDGRSAYVTNLNSHTITQYNIDPVSGKLSPKTPATVSASSPLDVTVSANGRSAYATNLGGAVSQYDVNPQSGVLSPKNPPSVAAGQAPEGIALTPDGTSAYVTNVNAADVSQYDVNSVTGVLTPKVSASVPSGDGPVGIAVSADAKSAYVTNFRGHSISQYDIDPATGRLSPKSPATVPPGDVPGTGPGFPFGIAALPQARVPTTKDQCMKGGWRNFPGFKNEGSCVAFVATQGKRPPT